MTESVQNTESIVLGGGCFWCIEPIFLELKGVISSVSGYCNGKNPTKPTYRDVCSGTTGYAEVIKVTFDTNIISLQEILRIFYHVHDPTTLNRQGNDKGTQYRSGIYFISETQRDVALAITKEISDAHLWSDAIVTEIAALHNYYDAEDYHQEYFYLNGSQPYCSIVIAPKMSKFRKNYADKLKANS